MPVAEDENGLINIILKAKLNAKANTNRALLFAVLPKCCVVQFMFQELSDFNLDGGARGIIQAMILHTFYSIRNHAMYHLEIS